MSNQTSLPMTVDLSPILQAINAFYPLKYCWGILIHIMFNCSLWTSLLPTFFHPRSPEVLPFLSKERNHLNTARPVVSWKQGRDDI